MRNMIIQQVLQMQFPAEEMSVVEPELPEHFVEMEILPQIDEEPTDSENQYHLKWSDNYKTACKIIYDKQSKMEDFQKAEWVLLSETESGNALAMFELGKLYASEKLGKKDVEKSVALYQEALQGFLLIEPKSKKIKPLLQYQIGRMYMKGLGTDVDMPKAITYFQQSAAHGNVYAKRIIALE